MDAKRGMNKFFASQPTQKAARVQGLLHAQSANNWDGDFLAQSMVGHSLKKGMATGGKITILTSSIKRHR